jgi:hypothetical protein
MRYLSFFIVLVLGGMVLSLPAQEAIHKLCDAEPANEDCQYCQSYLLEGWQAAQRGDYGDAIYKYTLADGVRYSPANELINSLLNDCKNSLEELRWEVIRKARELEQVNESLYAIAQEVEGQSEVIASQSDSIKMALSMVHARGRKAESFRIPSLADSLLAKSNYKDAVYLAFYGLLLQEDASNAPAVKALMEAGASYDTYSPSLLPAKPEEGELQAVEMLNDYIVIAKENAIFSCDSKKCTKLSLKLSPPFEQVFTDQKHQVAVVDKNGAIELWDVNKNSSEVFLPQHGELQDAFFDAHSGFLVSIFRNGKSVVYDLNKKSTIELGSGESRIYDVKVSSAHKIIVSRHNRGIAKAWNFKGEEINTFGEDEVHLHDLYLSNKDGGQVFTVNTMGQIKEWDLKTGKPGGDTKDIQAAAKNIWILSEAANEILYHTNNQLVIWKGDEPVSYSFDQRIIGLELNATQTEALVWCVGGDLFHIGLAAQQKARFLPKHNHSITSAAFSSDGKWVVSTADDGAVKMYDQDGDLILDWRPADQARVVARFSKDNNYLYLLSKDGATIRKCPLPSKLISDMRPQKQAIIKYLENNKAYGLQYLREI